MLFSGSTFFLSTKLSLPDTRTLSEHIRNGGGVLAPNNSDVNTITVLDTWEPKSMLVDMEKGHKLFYAGQAIIRYCVANETPLSTFKLPLMCMALSQQVIAFSGIASDTRCVFAQIVAWCGGIVQERLSSETTILVVGDVHPADLELARSKNLPCVTYEWLERVFQTKSLVEPELFAVPPLRGSVVALSGPRTRQAFTELKSIAQTLGCHFLMELESQDGKQTAPTLTHLVVDPKTVKRGPKTKYDHCKSKGIFVVSKDWLIECQKAKQWLPEHSFEIFHDDDPVCRVKRPIASHSKSAIPPIEESSASIHSPNNPKKRPHTDVQILVGDSEWKTESADFQPPHSKKTAPATQLGTMGPTSASTSSHSVAETSSTSSSSIIRVLPDSAAYQDSKLVVDPPKALEAPIVSHVSVMDESDANFLFSQLCFVAMFVGNPKLRGVIESRGGIYCEGPEQYALLEPGVVGEKQLFVVAAHGVYASVHQSVFESFVAQFRPSPLVVTIQWLEHCIRAGQVVTPSAFPLLFTPLPFTTAHYLPTMRNVTICTASISEPECTLLSALAVWLGSSALSPFYPTKTTHVITLSMDGKKQQAALKHGIPLVTPEWLYCCAKVGCRVEEHAFRVRATATIAAPLTAPPMPLPSPNLTIPSSSQIMPSASQQALGTPIQRPNHATTSNVVEYVDVFAKPNFGRTPETHFGAPTSFSPVSHSNWPSPGTPAAQQSNGYSGNAMMAVDGQWNRSEVENLPFPVLYENILSGVVIYFSKLCRPDSDFLLEMAIAMGAKTSWAYELSVTHVVTIGKPDLPIVSPKPSGKGHPTRDRPVNPLADHRPHCVSPQWLKQCSTTHQRVPEALFPSSLDPRSALGITMDPSHMTALPSSLSSHSAIAYPHTLDNWEAKRPSSLNIVQDSPSLSSSQSTLGKSNSPASSSHSTGSYIKRGMTSVVVPKTKVQSDFDEFDSLDTLYSTHRPIPAPPAPTLSNPLPNVQLIPLPTEIELPQVANPHIPLHSVPAPITHVPIIEPQAEVPVLVPEVPIPPISEAMVADEASIPSADVVVTHDAVDPQQDDESLMKVDSPQVVSDVGVPQEVEEAPQPILRPVVPSVVAMDVVPTHRVEPVVSALKVSDNQGSYPIDSQEVPISSQSQIVDPQMVEEMKAQTEMMRKLMASIPMLRAPTKMANNPYTASADGFGDLAPVVPLEPSLSSMSRHIARSALLDIVRGGEVGVRTESTHSSGSESFDPSVDPSGLDGVAGGLTASQNAAEYLHGTEFEAMRAPRVSYATLEPSEAVKSKMLGKAQNHIDSASFQESAAAEIRQLELIMSTPSAQQLQQHPPANVEPISEPPIRHLSNNSIKSGSSIASSSTLASSSKAPLKSETKEALEVDVSENPGKSTNAGPHKPPRALFPVEEEADDILAQLDVDYGQSGKDDTLASTGASRASTNLFGKPKRKSTSTATTLSTATNAPIASAMSPPEALSISSARALPLSSKSTGGRIAHSTRSSSVTSAEAALEQLLEEPQVGAFKDPAWPKHPTISVYLSGFDEKGSKKEYEQKLKHMGIQVSGRDGVWTHLVINTLKVTDRTMVSLSKGLWLVDLKWIDESLKAGKLLPEASFELRSSRQARSTAMQFDPRGCRQTVAKNGRGFFEGMKILFMAHQTLWTTVLRDSGSKVDIYKEDPAHPLTYSTVMQYDFIFTSILEWNSFSHSTQSLLNKSHVVVCEYFVEYLKSLKEPNVAEYHPKRRDTRC